MSEALRTLVDVIARHATSDGVHPSAIKGVSLVRSSAPTMPMPIVYSPTLCLVAQGRKQTLLGTTEFLYDAARYLIASVDLPVTGSVIQATRAKPYLSLVIDLNMTELSDLAIRHRAKDTGNITPPSGLALNATTPDLLDAAVRLASLLDRPRDIDALARLYMREILYRLLTGDGNRMIRHLAQSDSRLNQIARAIVWIREHFAERWSIDDLADIAAMSRSSFHVHFKAVTSMSPLTFRTQLRLQEARRIRVADSADAASAAFCVGYESPSQFSRDYARTFGVPPATHAKNLRLDATPAPL
jgi:AraC-like DNA-binding protein